MKIAVVGCVHGQISRAYAAIERSKIKPQLVIMCGDFQAFRRPVDMSSFSAPPKYRRMGDFHEYYSRKKRAPYLTIVVGGNHEASNYLSSMPSGGWLCPNIWYVGYSGIVNYKGLVIAGLSGIWYESDYEKPHFEGELFANNLAETSKTDAVYSAYHTRKIDIERSSSLPPVDIVVTHDWPRGIEQNGDLKTLLKLKPFFKQDIETGRLGNPASASLLDVSKPQWWLSAHLHVYYRATNKNTQFMASDKVLPRRHFLDFIDVHPRTNKFREEDFKEYKVKHFR